jgi:hypothetical protein
MSPYNDFDAWRNQVSILLKNRYRVDIDHIDQASVVDLFNASASPPDAAANLAPLAVQPTAALTRVQRVSFIRPSKIGTRIAYFGSMLLGYGALANSALSLIVFFRLWTQIPQVSGDKRQDMINESAKGIATGASLTSWAVSLAAAIAFIALAELVAYVIKQEQA